ncbi:MAG TPA: SusC/RagA family TonB-linked outer membrane protein [Gemmatimonadales bacterium]|nr:SusC/RagA family TonB-linked outer membrane protein [Gemmatimonadales bacterium]
MRNRTFGILLVPLSLLLPVILAAQQRQITGAVTRAEDGTPLPEAVVTLVGQVAGAKTDLHGQFVMNVPEGPVRLVARAIGRKRNEVTVAADQNEVKIALEQDVFKLEEVVVTGQATATTRENATTSTALVDGADLNQVQAQSVDRALEGRIAGANIQTNSGAPGAGAQVQIRGPHTIIGNADPLIVVDGIIYSNVTVPSGLSTVTASSSNIGNANAQDDGTNRLADINPDDIASIEVLKSAAAGSIYGSKAANGVIIIHTKRGQAGKIRANITQRVGFSELLRGPGFRTFDTTSAFALYPGDSALIRSLEVNGKLPAYDHLQELAGNKPVSYESQLDVSGGSERSHFFVSGAWMNTPGIITNTGEDRQTLRANVGQQLTNNLNLEFTNAFVRNNNDKGFTNNDNTGASVTYALAYIPSFIPLTPVNGVYPSPGITYFGANPLQTAALATNRETVIRYTGGATLTWNAWTSNQQSLKFVAAGGADFFNQKNKIIAPPTLTFEQTLPAPGVITLGNADNRDLNWNLNAIHTYLSPSQSLRATTSVGVQYEDRQLNTSRLTATGILPGQTDVSQGSVFSAPMETQTVERTLAFYGAEELLTLKERLVLLGSFRAERSSLFGDVSKLWFYPRASGAYKFPGLLGEGSNVKIRAAYGETGNQPQFGQKYTSLIGGQTYSNNGATTVSTSAGDANIEPELVKEFETGVDAEFWNGRATFQATWARNVTSNLILPRTPASSSGFSTEFLNGGSMRNISVELAAGVVPVRTKDLNWLVSATYTDFRNLVLSLPVPGYRPATAGFGLAFGEFFIQPGASATQIIGTVGYDVNGNPITKILGDANPDFRITLANDVTWKNLSMSMLWDWQQGGAAQNQTLSLYDCNQLASDDGSPSGQARVNACFTGIATPFVQSTTFLKLREVSLFWNVPQRWVQKLFAGADNARIGFTGRNLLLFTKYFGYDPESSNFGNQAITRNVDLGPYPPSRNFSFNVQVGF